MIELFVRWQLRFADSVWVADHASGDATGEILAALRDEGLPLEILRLEQAELEQAEVTSALARRAARDLGADWVLPFDADELLAAAEGGSPRQVIEKLDAGRLYRVPWRNYLPRPEDLCRDAPLLERIAHRRTREQELHHKLLVPGWMLRRRGARLTGGNHRLLRRAGLRQRKVESEEAPGLALAHFPVRSEAQLRVKVRVGWLARLAGAEQQLHPSKNAHLREMYASLRAGGPLEWEQVERLLRHYAPPPDGEGEGLVRDPLRPAGEPIALRYTSAGRIDPDAALLDLCERLALRQSEASARAFRWRLRRLLGFW
jgi:hypothetical protein